MILKSEHFFPIDLVLTTDNPNILLWGMQFLLHQARLYLDSR